MKSSLSARSRAVLDTLIPSGDPNLKRGALEAGFKDFYREFEATAIPSMRWGFRAALFIAAWVAPLLIGRLPPITLHDRETREAALAALGSSRIYLLRQILLLLKAVTAFSYGADPAVRAALGYPEQFDAGKPR